MVERAAAQQMTEGRSRRRRPAQKPADSDPMELPRITGPGTVQMPFAVPRDPVALWAAALDRLATQVTRPSFDTFLSRTVPVAIDGAELVVQAVDRYSADWLAARMSVLVREAVSAASDGVLNAVSFVADPPSPSDSPNPMDAMDEGISIPSIHSYIHPIPTPPLDSVNTRACALYSRDEAVALSDAASVLAFARERCGLRSPTILLREVGAAIIREGLLQLHDDIALGDMPDNPAGKLVVNCRRIAAERKGERRR